MKRLMFIALLLAAIIAPAASAQENEPLLLIRPYQGNFLLAYDGVEVRPIIEYAPPEGIYSGFPVVYSPDASRFAYLARVGDGNQTRIYIADLANEALIEVAGQDAAKVRSNPAWSPDGERIAWNQVDPSGENLQTIVYDFASGSGQVVYERAERSAAFVVPAVEWRPGGLAIYDHITLDSQQHNTLTYANPNTGEFRTVELDRVAQIGRWAQYGGTERFVLDVEGSRITVFVPETDTVETITGRLELYSLSATESIGLTQDPSDNQWAVFGPDFNGGLGVDQSEYSVTIAPDGQRLAVVTFENYPFGGKAYILDSFEGFPYASEPIPGLDSAGYSEEGALYVFWGPTGLRIVE